MRMVTLILQRYTDYSKIGHQLSKSMESKPFDNETENYCRLWCLVTEKGTEAMRKFFLKHNGLQPKTFHTFMKANENNFNNKLKGLHETQRKLLFPSEGEADINKLDITLLCKMIRHLCGFKKIEDSKTDWEAKLDNPKLANVIHLKNFRNFLGHKPHPHITEADFKEELDRLSAILQVLGVNENEIKPYASKIIRETEQQKIIDEIKKLREKLKETVLHSQIKERNPTVTVDLALDDQLPGLDIKVATRTTSGGRRVQNSGENEDVRSTLSETKLEIMQQTKTQSVVKHLTDEFMMRMQGNFLKERGDALQLCFNAVKQNYRQTRNQIQLLPWDPSKIVTMDTLFTDITLFVDLLKPGIQHKIPLKSYHDIFTHIGDPITRVLCYGRAGIGKSTLINKMAYDWANENSNSPIKRFKLVVALSMQKISRDENVVDALFKHRILTQEYCKYKDLLNQFVKENPGEVAVLLDACDEYKPQSNESQGKGEIVKLLTNEHQRSSVVVVTSRPWKVDALKEYRGIYLHCEIHGFSTQNIGLYVDKFFHEDPDSGKALIRYLHDNGLITGIATLPMMTMILCWLWKVNAPMKLPETLSELYQKLLEHMIMTHLNKSSENKEQLTKYLEKDVEIIGRVGLDGLFNNMTLTFRECDFNASAEMEGTTSNKVVLVSCKIGLLTRDMSGNVPHKEQEDKDTDDDDSYFPIIEKLEESMKPAVEFLFFHKTAQEKCAAMYAAKLARRKPEEFQSYLDRITTVKDAFQFEMLLLFLSGEHIDVAKLVLTHLHKIFKKELSVNSDSYVAGKLSFEESMRFQTYLELVVRCYHESQCHGSLNDVMALIFKQRHIRFSNFSSSTANSLGYLLKYSEAQEDPPRYVHLNIDKVELINIRLETKKEKSTLWEMFPDDEEDEFIRKYSEMPTAELSQKLRECQMEETLPPAFQEPVPDYQCLSGMKMSQVTSKYKGDATDIKTVVSSLQNVNLEKITILGFDISTMADVLPNALRKSTLTVINLSSANVGPEICRTVATFLEQTHNLKELILKDNPLGDGIGFLAESFKYIRKLTNLNVSYSPVTEQGMVTLSQTLHEVQKMEKLSLYQLYDAASDSFSQGIQNMKALKLITLPLQWMSDSEANRIVGTASQCRQLVELKITDMTNSCDLMVSCAAENLIEMPYLKILSLCGKRDEDKLEEIKKECTITTDTCNAVVKMLERIESLEILQVVSLWMPKDGLQQVAVACENHPNLNTFRYSGECIPPGIVIENLKKIQLC